MVPNNTPFRILGIAFLGIVATSAFAQTAPTVSNVRASDDQKSQAMLTSPQLLTDVQAHGRVAVIVLLAGDRIIDKSGLRHAERKVQVRQAVAAAQNDVLTHANLAALIAGRSLTVERIYRHTAAFSATVDATALRALQGHPAVASIEPNALCFPHDAEGAALMNVAPAYSAGYDGSGISIAIVDTGIDYTHSELGGAGFPNPKVIGGFDLGDNDPDPMDCQGHGTACAGIAAGATLGIAYGARLVGLKIVSGSAGSGSLASIFDAWDWAIEHQDDDPANPILFISTSFGDTSSFSSACDTTFPTGAAIVQSCVNAGISVYVSSGNEGRCNGIATPACLSQVNAVGAVYDANIGSPGFCLPDSGSCVGVSDANCSTAPPYDFRCEDISTAADQVTCYSNSASILDLFAPSHCATTAALGGGTIPCFGGTSAACPYAVGAAALLQHNLKALSGGYYSTAGVRAAMLAGGDPVNDPKANPGVTKPRANVGGALVAAPPLVFVDASALGSNDGTSWTNAYNHLQGALNELTITGASRDIWVAQGIYMPDGAYIPVGGSHVPGTGDRWSSFRLLRGVGIYGGFAGGETEVSQRNIAGNPTILSGDLAGDDTPVPCTQDSPDCTAFGDFGGVCIEGYCIISRSDSENSYTVVYAHDTDSDPTALLDGVTITAANGASGAASGGMVTFGSPTVINCTLKGIRGWAMENLNNTSNPEVISCTFTRNSAGMRNSNTSSPTVRNCMFSANSGVGMANLYGSSPVVAECTFVGNRGGGMTALNSSPIVTNSIFVANSGSGMSIHTSNNVPGGSSAPTVTNCTFIGNSASTVGAGIYNSGEVNAQSEPRITNCTFSANLAFNAGTFVGGAGMYSYVYAFPLVANCVFWGNVTDPDGSSGGPFMDESAQINRYSGNSTVWYSIVQGWTGAFGGSGNIGNEPLFIDTDGSDNIPGTLDDNLRLIAGSPAIDAGNNSAVTVATDLDGNSRIVDGNGDGAGTVDMGAYEFQSVTCVSGTCIPAVSEWGLFSLTLCLLTAGTMVLRRRS